MFSVNGKVLKEAIDVVMVKGKWHIGNTASNSSLGNAIVFEVGDECYLYNCNESTYIRKKVTPVETTEEVRFCVDSTVLCKYLTNDNTTITIQDETMKINNGSSIVTIPLLERHPHNDALLTTKKRYVVDIETMNLEDYQKGIRISPRTVLNTVVKVSATHLTSALKQCENAGSSIYKLEYNDDVMSVSSEMNNETVQVDIEVDGAGEPATMEFTAPLHKLINNSVVILAFNDDSPLSVISRDMLMLRAPRIGRD